MRLYLDAWSPDQCDGNTVLLYVAAQPHLADGNVQTNGMVVDDAVIPLSLAAGVKFTISSGVSISVPHEMLMDSALKMSEEPMGTTWCGAEVSYRSLSVAEEVEESIVIQNLIIRIRAVVMLSMHWTRPFALMCRIRSGWACQAMRGIRFWSVPVLLTVLS